MGVAVLLYIWTTRWSSSKWVAFLPRYAMLTRYLLSLRVRLSVRLSDTSRYCIETTVRIELVLAWRLPSTYPTLCYKEIGYLQNPCGILSQTPENFARAMVDRVVNKTHRCGRRRSSLLTSRTTGDESWLLNYYKSVNCIGSNLYYFDSLLNVDLLYNLFLQ